MKRLFLAGLLACLFAAASVNAAPLEAYGRLPAIEDLQISPDGAMIAGSLTLPNDKRQIIVRKLADNSVVYFIEGGSVKVRDLRWASPRHIVITTSRTASAQGIQGGRREYLSALLIDVTTSKTKQLLANEEASMNVVTRPPEVRMIDGAPSLIIYGYRHKTERGADRSRLYLSVFRYDLASGRTSVLAQGDDGIDDWEIGPSGEVVAKSLYNQRSGRWRLLIRDGADWKTVAEEVLPLGSPSLRGLGRTPGSVVTLSPAAAQEGDTADVGDEQNLREYRADGSWDLPSSMRGLIYDPSSSLLIGASELIGDQGRYVFFDPKADAAWKAIAKAYPGQQVSLTSWSQSRRKIVVRVEDPTMGPAFALADLDKKSASWIGDVYKLGEDDVALVKPVSYKAQDGLDISGYLTLPRGKDPKKLPLIVLPHGGPATRDRPGFDWWSQALASRGYAVLQPNFRGSDGFGDRFLAAGFGEWGRKMQTDVSDGVKHLAKEGVIDLKRVCIVGASYGGYAALAGVTVEQGLYRCSVSVNGVADLKRMLLSTPRRSSVLRYWTNFMGVEGARDRDLDAISPAVLAARADAPILLIHGRDDTVVPYDQSVQMARALKQAGKPHEFVTLPGEDHWLSRGDTRLQMLQSTVAFLERENPPN
ncbi:S9 family peptidase [Caulobacter segnis]|uniref:alpha/beta hydrolase family protein n=1 Tax=Caulobacter segnis TaxID=88688 RepID=UPI0024100BE1|nr:S9 family peptidase [Caulobacter segnis]MDG2523249.1 S9 family peptidase [Caulobacter segnis]